MVAGASWRAKGRTQQPAQTLLLAVATQTMASGRCGFRGRSCVVAVVIWAVLGCLVLTALFFSANTRRMAALVVSMFAGNEIGVLPESDLANGGGFALVAPGRTGSSWSTHLLDSHPRVRMYGEIMHGATDLGPADIEKAHQNGHGSGTGSRCFSRLFRPSHKLESRAEFLNMFFHDRLCEYGFCNNTCNSKHNVLQAWPNKCGIACAPNRTRSTDMVGIKLLHGDQLNGALPVLASYRGFRFILLSRQDLLMRVLSKFHMSSTSKKDRSDGRYTHHPLQVDPATVLERVQHDLRQEGRHWTVVEQAHKPMLKVVYEDLLAAAAADKWSTGPWGEIFDFLGLPPNPLQVQRHVVHPKDTLADVQKAYPNIVEIRAFVRAKLPKRDRHRAGCELSHLFPDDPC